MPTATSNGTWSISCSSLAAWTSTGPEFQLVPDPPCGSERVALLCEEIGEPLEHGLAARRYAIPGDRRALHGTVL